MLTKKHVPFSLTRETLQPRDRNSNNYSCSQSDNRYFSKLQWAYESLLLVCYRVYYSQLAAKITILISHDRLPSGLVAQLVEQRWSVPVVVGSNPTGVRDFFSFSVLAHFLFRANTQKVLFGIFIRALQIITF